MMLSGVFAMESTCGLCGGQRGTGTVFFSGYFSFPWQCNLASALYLFSHPSLLLCSLSSW